MDLTNIAGAFASSSAELLIRMSPFLLLGCLFAGLIHTFIPMNVVANHVGQRGLWAVIKSVAFGIPLPLCSCSVIPAALTIRRKGASRGAVVSFLIATPITGVDSIMATYSLMGPVFTLGRIIAGTITSLLAGIFTNILVPEDKPPVHLEKTCCAKLATPKRHWLIETIHYALFDLLEDIWKALLIGVLIGGLILTLIPETWITTYLGYSWQAMLMMLLAGIPMYICATGSIPIAASLMLKGMSPGAGLVFLLAGPATNAVTITLVMRELGHKAAILYVASISICSVLLGQLFNVLWLHYGWAIDLEHGLHATITPRWLELACSVILVLLIITFIVQGIIKKNSASH